MTSLPKVPEWPDKPKLPVNTPWREDVNVLYDYERARAEAALARLMVAVNTLERIRREVDNSEEDGDSLDYVSCWVREALSTIGEVP